jgi:hypothetical protein
MNVNYSITTFGRKKKGNKHKKKEGQQENSEYRNGKQRGIREE